MPFLGVVVAVIQENRILLTRREDFEVWCLPGGAIEDGESPAEAAIREVKEETGLVVRIERLVGVYSIPDGPRGGSHLLNFAGVIAGGLPNPEPSEVLEMRFFARDEIPQVGLTFGDSR